MNWAGSIFDTAGSQAERIARLAWFIIAVSTVVYVLVLAATALAVRRARARTSRGDLADQAPETERRLTRHVLIATGVSTILLLVYVTVTAQTGRAIAWPMNSTQQPLTVEVTGHQWWWEFRYRDSVPSNWLSTSNELHIPVGRPVRVILLSNDVIHSFWVPELHGKQDAIPGHRNTTWLQADRPGVWKARCAEFCGYQHAKMALVVVAEPPADYERWSAAQRAPAREPATAQERRGLALVEQTSCAMCHAIHGTRARARRAPDLTHVASRGWLGAGAVENTPELRAEWIARAQKFKPGVNMPPLDAAPDDLAAMSAYLGSLR